MEFVLRFRCSEFFDYFYTYRTIWLKLQADLSPPIQNRRGTATQ